MKRNREKVRQLQILAKLWLMEKENPCSLLNRYLERLELKFILENLNNDYREIFLEKLDYKKGKALAFAKSQIPDFERKLETYLQINLQKIAGKVVPG